jgi:hypothetical protein
MGKVYEGHLIGTGLKFGIVIGRFNELPFSSSKINPYKISVLSRKPIIAVLILVVIKKFHLAELLTILQALQMLQSIPLIQHWNYL